MKEFLDLYPNTGPDAGTGPRSREVCACGHELWKHHVLGACMVLGEKVVGVARGYFVWAQGQFTSGGDAHDYLAAALARHDLANIGAPTAPTPAEPPK